MKIKDRIEKKQIIEIQHLHHHYFRLDAEGDKQHISFDLNFSDIKQLYEYALKNKTLRGF